MDIDNTLYNNGEKNQNQFTARIISKGPKSAEFICLSQPVSLKRRLQTADCGPGVKCRLQTKSKAQAGVKCRPSINCSRGRV